MRRFVRIWLTLGASGRAARALVSAAVFQRSGQGSGSVSQLVLVPALAGRRGLVGYDAYKTLDSGPHRPRGLTVLTRRLK